jgi:hypothetical protein
VNFAGIVVAREGYLVVAKTNLRDDARALGAQ